MHSGIKAPTVEPLVPVCDVPDEERCLQRSPRTSLVCRRPKGHEGRHANFWVHLPPPYQGRVRDVWS